MTVYEDHSNDVVVIKSPKDSSVPIGISMTQIQLDSNTQLLYSQSLMSLLNKYKDDDTTIFKCKTISQPVLDFILYVSEDEKIRSEIHDHLKLSSNTYTWNTDNIMIISGDSLMQQLELIQHLEQGIISTSEAGNDNTQSEISTGIALDSLYLTEPLTIHPLIGFKDNNHKWKASFSAKIENGHFIFSSKNTKTSSMHIKSRTNRKLNALVAAATDSNIINDKHSISNASANQSNLDHQVLESNLSACCSDTTDLLVKKTCNLCKIPATQTKPKLTDSSPMTDTLLILDNEYAKKTNLESIPESNDDFNFITPAESKISEPNTNIIVAAESDKADSQTDVIVNTESENAEPKTDVIVADESNTDAIVATKPITESETTSTTESIDA